MKNFEQQEEHLYSPGTPVEFIDKPGQVHIIAEYDSTMVPPIWLEDDSMPHYPHEFKRVSNLLTFLSSRLLHAA